MDAQALLLKVEQARDIALKKSVCIKIVSKAM
jgi:hypothetical protein